MTRGPREVNFLPRAIDQGGERDFSGQVESEVNIKNIFLLNYIKRMSGIHLAIPVFSKGYRPKQGKVAP